MNNEYLLMFPREINVEFRPHPGLLVSQMGRLEDKHRINAFLIA